MNRLRGLTLFFLLVGFTVVEAQTTTCPAIFAEVLPRVGEVCGDPRLNYVCYGNDLLEAEFQEGVVGETFKQAGDEAQVVNLLTLRSQPIDVAANVFGVALMKIQANVPDTLPGQGVTFILFGNAELTNEINTPTAEVKLVSDTVLRAAPSDDGQIVGVFVNGDTATALGKSADGDWLRVEITAADGRVGWIPLATVAASDAVAALASMDGQPASPMQAFYLRPSVTGPRCLEAPDGLLVQTPSEVVQIELTVNEARLVLGSTAFIQTQNGEMTISLLEGKGRIEAPAGSVDIPGGFQVHVPLDPDGRVAGAPSQPETYDASVLPYLPLDLLPEPLTPVTAWAVGQTVCVKRPDGAWLRALPDSNSLDIVRVVQNGTALSVDGEAQSDGAQNWARVRTGDSQVGWIEQASLVVCDQPVVPTCTPRADWAYTYTVQAGDTLSRIAQTAGSTTNELATGNCLQPPYPIYTGQVLRLPRPIVILTPESTVPREGIPPLVIKTDEPWPSMSDKSGNWTVTIVSTPDPQCSRGKPTTTTEQIFVDVAPDSSTLTLRDQRFGSPYYRESANSTIYYDARQSQLRIMSSARPVQARVEVREVCGG